MPTIECDPDEARQRLEAAGVSVSPGNTDHERWRAERGDASVAAYDGKIVVQGSRPTDLLALIRPKDSHTHIYFDGTSRGNPGPTAIGWAIVTSDGIVAESSERIGETTNNRAEYEALVEALSIAEEYGYDEVDMRGDSQLIVKQARGEWNTDDPGLKERHVKARELLSAFERWSLEYVPREISDRADSLANEALDDA